MRKQRVLVLDGGGAKGVIQSMVLKEIESRTGKKICNLFDLIVGTSVGAILGGIYATGELDASLIHRLIKDNVKEIFKKRLFRIPKYTKKYLKETFDHYLPNYTMGDCKASFICTSVNMVDGKTHYFKSWEKKDSQIGLFDAVDRSSAAPLYFDSIKDPENGAVWLDGGVGNANNPILESIVQIVRDEMLIHNHVHILNIGTGYHESTMSYKRASRSRSLRQIGFFMDPKDGGLARNQAIQSKASQVEAITQCIENFSYQRLDIEIPEEIDVLDGVKYVEEYENTGVEMINNIEWENLLDN